MGQHSTPRGSSRSEGLKQLRSISAQRVDARWCCLLPAPFPALSKLVEQKQLTQAPLWQRLPAHCQAGASLPGQWLHDRVAPWKPDASVPLTCLLEPLLQRALVRWGSHWRSSREFFVNILWQETACCPILCLLILVMLLFLLL